MLILRFDYICSLLFHSHVVVMTHIDYLLMLFDLLMLVLRFDTPTLMRYIGDTFYGIDILMMIYVWYSTCSIVILFTLSVRPILPTFYHCSSQYLFCYSDGRCDTGSLFCSILTIV